jgi:hypothetical protein
MLFPILLPLNFRLKYSGPNDSEALEFVSSESFCASSYRPAFFLYH